MRALLIGLFLASATYAQQSLGELHARLAAAAPIDGVSVGVLANKATWVIQFRAAATAPQRAAAQTIIDNWTEQDWDGTPAQRRQKAIDRIEALDNRVETLKRLKVRLPARAAQIQAVIDNLEAQIDALVPQT